MMTTLKFLPLILWLISVNLISTNSDLFNKEERYKNHEATWEILLKTVRNLLILQHSNGHFSEPANHVAIVYPDKMSRLALRFQDICSSLNIHFLYLDLRLSDVASFNQIENMSRAFEVNFFKTNIQAVVLFCEDSQWVTHYFQAVCSNVEYRWTYLLHITEWIVLSKNSNVFNNLKSKNPCLDYVTFITASGSNLVLSRKSRGHIFNSTLEKCIQSNKAIFVGELSNLFTDLTRRRKSSLEGLNIPVAFFAPVPKRSWVVKVGNETSYDGFSIATLDELADFLGFTYTLVPVTDGGLYGSVTENGTATGSVGLVARREVALSAIGLNRIANRLQVIDFLDYATEIGDFIIVYSLPDPAEQLDPTLVDIVSTEYYLYLLGSFLFIALIGGLTHVATKSCTSVAPKFFKKKDLRRLASFPSHIFFQRERKYVGQTGRVLRASWAVFFVIFSAAYSAYLVTTFTVRPKELRIDSFQDLIEQSSYRFGVQCSLQSLITLFRTSKSGELYKLWKRLVYFNKTDPWTLSCNVTEHMLKVLEGGYAFLPSYEIDEGIQKLQQKEVFSQVRSYPTPNSYGLGRNYLSLPYNVFYKEELNAAMLYLEDSGIFVYLRKKYGIDDYSSVKVTTLASEKPVPLSRILLLIFVTIGGVTIGVVCLFLEIFFADCFK